jgi:hypothetical protein
VCKHLFEVGGNIRRDPIIAAIRELQAAPTFTRSNARVGWEKRKSAANAIILNRMILSRYSLFFFYMRIGRSFFVQAQLAASRDIDYAMVCFPARRSPG